MLPMFTFLKHYHPSSIIYMLFVILDALWHDAFAKYLTLTLMVANPSVTVM